MNDTISIRDYIRDHTFGERAKESGTLVIYDSERRYKDIALEMASDTCRVIDASLSIIEQREAATEALAELAEGVIHQLIIWIPAKPPADDDARQRDPFAVFAAIGNVFPKGDGDDYISLCRRAMPDHVSEIERLFGQSEPSFEMVDALSQGGSWPKLKTLLGASSSKEIILGILSPNAAQEAALKREPSWVTEAHEFIERSLGHTLKTRGQTRKSIADELWRVVLFSEFYIDSKGNIPPSLQTIPHAGFEARSLVFDVCDDLRKHADHKDLYCNTANEIEAEYALEAHTKSMFHLGERDTFSFEERFFLQRMVDIALEGHFEKARELYECRRKSIWMGQGERLAEWTLAARALDLLDVAKRMAAPKFPTLESIIHGYAMTWRDLDRLHREMEQAVNHWQGDHVGLDAMAAAARTAYFNVAEALQAEFIRLVTAEGWPVSGDRLVWNNQVFSKIVNPLLANGERVAFFLVDSLRYELGVEIEKQLSDKCKVTIQTVCAQLPTYTEVGMASLMPDAESQLKLTRKEGKLLTTLGDQPTTSPATRFAYLQSKKGDQCADVDLADLLKQKKPKFAEKIRILIVRTSDIDSLAHGTQHQVLEVIPTLVRQLIRGLAKVADLGFHKAVIATDHGFILIHEQEAGNVVPRPAGSWLLEKQRCMLGQGQADSSSVVMKSSHLGIPGDFAEFAAPKTLAPYMRGQMYYHEGLSLQECVLPCLVVELVPSAKTAKAAQPVELMLSYRQGKSDCITTRRPVLDLVWSAASLFAEEREIEVTVEAIDTEGKTVGWVGSSSGLNPATGGVRIKPGMAVSVGLRMEEDFSGKFSVRALDTATSMQLASLNLRTGYME